ncbi:piwi 1 isoform X1 [Octopus vulgaris]|nr:piwi 1 isoform X1 [Octopus vulgaris]
MPKGRSRGRAGRGQGDGSQAGPRPGQQGDGPQHPQQAPQPRFPPAHMAQQRPPMMGDPGPRQPAVRQPMPRQPAPHAAPLAATAAAEQSGGAAAAPVGSGRASYRGGAQPAPVGGAERLAKEFGRLSMRTRDEFVETKPANLTVRQGVSGTPVQLYCNYFEILAMPQYSLHHYHVSFAPEIEGKRIRKALLMQHAEKYFGHLHLFDGMMLFLPQKLPDKLELVSKCNVTDQIYTITVTWRCKVVRTSPTIIQLLNILYKQILSSLHLVQIGRNYYSIPDEIPRDNKLAQTHKLTVFDGIQSSILNYEKGAMLCVDISHKVMRTDTVADLMRSCRMHVGASGWKETIMKRLLGKIVLTRYNNRTYRVDDIDMDMLPTRTFRKHNEDVSFVSYYKTNYGINIRHLDLPMLLSKPKARDIRRGQNTPIYLVPELVVITGLDDDVRTNYEIMKDLAQTTRLTPETRVERLKRFIGSTRKNKDAMELVEKWKLQLSDNLAAIAGRVLEPEKMYSSTKSLSYQSRDPDWSRDLRDMSQVATMSVDRWLLLYPMSCGRMAKDLESCLQRVAKPLGIRYAEPYWCEIQGNDASGQGYISAIKEKVTESTQLVVALVYDNSKGRYDAIKKFCSIDQPAGKPVPSQVIVQRTLNRKNVFMSIATKIAIQINCKLGGVPWCVTVPIKRFMIVGIDHYHDSAKKGHSVGGIVASMNNEMTKWYSRTTFQTAHEELSSKLHIVTQMLLKRYYEINNCFPERIFIFRDGVGDGQLNVLLNYEVKQYTEAFKNFPDANFRLTVVVVKKRINTRLFSKAGVQWINPLPGTVVDSAIVRNEWYDFFIVSQSVRQGTVSPTHYNVIYDTSGLKPDHIQKLTYKMCHLYYNWPGTIRVPAPCQYAHKLAFLVGQSIHKEPAMVLRDKLFYL